MKYAPSIKLRCGTSILLQSQFSNIKGLFHFVATHKFNSSGDKMWLRSRRVHRASMSWIRVCLEHSLLNERRSDTQCRSRIVRQKTLDQWLFPWLEKRSCGYSIYMHENSNRHDESEVSSCAQVNLKKCLTILFRGGWLLPHRATAATASTGRTHQTKQILLSTWKKKKSAFQCNHQPTKMYYRSNQAAQDQPLISWLCWLCYLRHDC